jgi:outer membrane protein TolC
MSDRFEPDAKFVDRLEWQLASEFRRREHLKPAPGRIAVPRPIFVIGLAAGVLLLGVAATKAADLLKDSWRKRIEVARLETEVKIKTAFLDFKELRFRQAEEKFKAGLIGADGLHGNRLARGNAVFEVEKALLDLEEVRASGQAPRDELHAPLVDGRDFVSERLEARKRALESDILLRRGRTEGYWKQRFDLGLIAESELEDRRAMVAVQETELEAVETRLGLRRQILSGALSAEQLEIRIRMAEAEKELGAARREIGSMKKHLDTQQAQFLAGLITEEEMRGTRMVLDAAQARAEQALQEIEILKKIR